VLNLIDATVRGAQEAGRVTGGGWVGVCGGWRAIRWARAF
jgi:phosphoenolpyruvate-protein kinase (PTS system EI component)